MNDYYSFLGYRVPEHVIFKVDGVQAENIQLTDLSHWESCKCKQCGNDLHEPTRIHKYLFTFKLVNGKGVSIVEFGSPENITVNKRVEYKDERWIYTRFPDYKNTASGFIRTRSSASSNSGVARFTDWFHTMLFGF